METDEALSDQEVKIEEQSAEWEKLLDGID